MQNVDRLRGLIVAVVLIALLGPATATAIDTGSARVHIAGPDTLLLEGVLIEEEPYVVYLAADGTGAWRVTSIEPQTEGVLPWDIVLDLATLSVDPGGQLRIDNIFLDGRFFSGAIAFDAELDDVASYRFFESVPPNLDESPLLQQLADAYGLTAGPSSAGSPTPVEEPVPTQQVEAVDPAPATTSPDTAPPPARDNEALGSDVAVIERIDRYAEEGARRLDDLEERVEALSRTLDRAVADGSRAVSALMATVVAGAGDEYVVVSPAPAASTAPAPGLTDDYAPTAAIHRARAEFSVLERPDMAGGQPLNGDWRVAASSGAVSQIDEAARFAKLRLSYEQDSRPRLYRLVTRAPGEGWAGTGLHFAITDVALPAGYGHGRSVLVWLTRDTAVYGTDTTFLELYVSSNDVDMNRVVQVPLGSNLVADHAIEVLFDPGAGLLTVAVNGVEHVRYRLPRPAVASVELSLRALGRVEFSELEIRRSGDR